MKTTCVRDWPDVVERFARLCRRHPIALGFAAVAVAVRLIFWAYTGRIWEDALITMTPARNLWAGNGLTHHVSEPRVHSFTSPVSVLIPIVGEPVGAGLLLLRLSALVASVFTIVFAARIASVLRWRAVTQVFVLGFLATDQLQVFFGMSGMETQVATMVMVVGVYALLADRSLLLGAALGAAVLCRPEFLLWVVLAGVVLVVRYQRDAVRPLALGGAIVAPWLLFTTVYYGSPIPHTIVAKSLYPGSGLSSHSITEMLAYTNDLWKTLSPFKSFVFAYETPVPDLVLQLTVLVVVWLAVAGGVALAWRTVTNLAPLAFVALFYAYETVALVNQYFMWYLPPIAAVAVIYAGHGLDLLMRTSQALILRALPIALFAMYAIHIPFTYPLDREVQVAVEDGVRREVGRYLDQVMDEDDTVVLEPLGYIGWEAFNKTTWDYPGLSSVVVTDTLRRLPESERHIQELTRELHPTHLVLRDTEWVVLQTRFPDVASNYRVLRQFTASPNLDLSRGGLSYSSVDKHFFVLERISVVDPVIEASEKEEEPHD